jgi:DNA-binding response OmpR family regulator
VLNQYDLIILDIMMPNRDGLEVCNNLRKRNIHTPIIFLTARDTTDDKIVGLDSGADDYIVKPFSFEELFARIRTILRRSPEMTADILQIDALILNTRSQSVVVGDQKVHLTLREYGVLEYLMRHQGAVVTRGALLEHVWDRFHDPFTNVINVHIKNLRKKLPDEYAKRIETVWGKGYRLI